jgi:hypothetical protein
MEEKEEEELELEVADIATFLPNNPPLLLEMVEENVEEEEEEEEVGGKDRREAFLLDNSASLALTAPSNARSHCKECSPHVPASHCPDSFRE